MPGILPNEIKAIVPFWLKLCAGLSLLSTAALYISLPVPHSMALRNLLLLLSLASGIVVIANSGRAKEILHSRPLHLLALLLGWVVFHAAFLSADNVDAWQELWGQWCKPYLALVAGVGCVLSAEYFRPRTFAVVAVCALVAQPLLFAEKILAFAIKWGVLTANYLWIYVHKLGFLPFVEIMAAFALSRLALMMNQRLKWGVAFWLLLLIASFFIAVFTTTRNTLLLLSVMSLLMLANVLYRKPAAAGKRWHLGLGVAMLLMVVAGMSGSLKSNMHWTQLIADAKVAVQIDEYRNWQNRTKYGLPMNELGQPVSESNYLRFAYAMAGLREIAEHPLGYGVSRHAFERLVQQKNPEASIANSHSGYIDLVAAVGVPALIMLLVAEVMLIRQAHATLGANNYVIWILGVIMLHWAIDPLSRDQHVYALFLLCGIFAMTTLNRSEVVTDGDLRDR